MNEDDLQVLRVVRDELGGDGWEAKAAAINRILSEAQSPIKRRSAPIYADGRGPLANQGTWRAAHGHELQAGDSALALAVVRMAPGAAPTPVLILHVVERWHAMIEIIFSVLSEPRDPNAADPALRKCSECGAAMFAPCVGPEIASASVVLADALRDARPEVLAYVDRLRAMTVHASRSRANNEDNR